MAHGFVATGVQYPDGTTQTTASAGAKSGIFWENDQTLSVNYTIAANKNALTAGPITIAEGVTITISDGATWTVV